MRKSRWFFVLSILSALLLPLEASIIKKPPAKTGEIAYKDLSCSPQDQEKIRTIISMMGEHSKLSLWANQNHLREMGAQIAHVHPMKFLTTILTDPHLKSCMMIIWNDYFKRKGFLGSTTESGLTPSLNREADKGKLNQYIPEFAAELQTPAEALRPFFESRDWENLVQYLIYHP